MASLWKKTKNTLTKKYGKFTPQQKKMIFILEFLIRFLVAATPIYFIMYFNIDLYAIQVIEAEHIKSFVEFFGVYTETYMLGVGSRLVPVIRIPEILKDIAIDAACTGYRSVFAFIGLVLAYPRVKNKKRVYGILLGVPIIYAVNIVRVVTTILAGVWFGADKIDIVHTILWREGLIFIIFFLWIAWLKIFVHPK